MVVPVTVSVNHPWRLFFMIIGGILMITVIVHILRSTPVDREGFLGKLLPIPRPLQELGSHGGRI